MRLSARKITAIATAAVSAVIPACTGAQYVNHADLLLFFDAAHNPVELFESWDINTDPTLPPSGIYFLVAGDKVERIGDIGAWVKVRVRAIVKREHPDRQQNMLTALIAKHVPQTGQTGYVDRSLFRSSFSPLAHELR